jgi:hypothetical protein
VANAALLLLRQHISAPEKDSCVRPDASLDSSG